MPKTLGRSHRQRKRETLRRLYGNPWDSSSSSSRNATRHSFSQASKKSKKRVTFRQPLVRGPSKSKSTTSTSHAAWHSVSSK